MASRRATRNGVSNYTQFNTFNEGSVRRFKKLAADSSSRNRVDSRLQIMDQHRHKKKILSELKRALKIEKYTFGMEFVVLFIDKISNPFTCLLCAKKGNLFNIIVHLKGIPHQVNVLEKSLPSIMIQVQEMFPKNDIYKENLVTSISRTIEGITGPQMPVITTEKAYTDDPELMMKILRPSDYSPEIIKKVGRIVSKAKQRTRDMKESRAMKSLSDAKSKHRESNNQKPSESNTSHAERKRKHENGTSQSSRKRKIKSPARSSTSNVRPSVSQKTSIHLYTRQYELDGNKLDSNYKRYQKTPELHPRYQEEWNDFWLNEFYKLDHLTGLDSCDFSSKWRARWRKRLDQMKDEDVLEIRLTLRKQFDLPVESSDEAEYKNYLMKRRVKLNRKQPVVPIIRNGEKVDVVIPLAPSISLIDLNEISSSIDRFNIKSQSQPQASSSKAVERSEVAPPNPFCAISNADLATLFGSFDSLSEVVRGDLIAFMQNLEAHEPERYKNVMEVAVIEPTQDLATESPKAAATSPRGSACKNQSDVAIDDGDDSDYSLKDLVGCLANTEGKETICLLDQRQIHIADEPTAEKHQTSIKFVDLTVDSETDT